MNFFNWIREGVRQAVLYGVSDAVGEMGESPHGENMHQRLLEVLKTTPEPAAPRLTAASSSGTIPSRRKRLGRSLSDVQTSSLEQ